MLPLFFVVFLDLVGFGMVIPVFPFYAERVGASDSLVIFLLGLYSVGQLVGAPLWGAVSDRLGRRPILLATLFANAAASVMLAHAGTPMLLGLSRLVAGLAAGNISTAYAYVTDRTTDLDRPKALGMLGAAFGLGFILGPALGALIAGTGSAGGQIRNVAYGAGALSLLAFIATLIWLPESLTAERRAQRGTARRESPLGLAVRPGLRGLLATTLLVFAAVSVQQTSLALWGARTLGLGPRSLGFYYSYVGVISVVIQARLIGALTRRFGSQRLAEAGTVMIAIAVALIPFTHGAALLLTSLGLFGAGGALFNPSISTLVAGTAAPDERGAVLGVYQGSSSLGRVVGPVAASGITAAMGGLDWPFALGAATALVGAAVLVRARGAVSAAS